MRLCLVSSLLFASLSLAQEKPTAQQLSIAAECKSLVDSLVPRGKAVTAHREAVANALAKAGVEVESDDWSEAKGSPSREDMSRLDTEVTSLKREAETLRRDCAAYGEKVRSLKLGFPLSMAEQNCNDWYRSMHQKGDCTGWKKLAVAFWPAEGDCDDPADEARRRLDEFARFRQDWDSRTRKEDALAAEEHVLLEAVSGSPGQRAVLIPRRFTRFEGNTRIVDTLGLFDAAHASHFVFLRKNVSEAPRFNPQEGPQPFSRTLQKGEAVLPLRSSGPERDFVHVISVDGNEGYVPVEDLSTNPLSGARVAPLTADGLNVRSDDGTIVAGPTWLEPDTTGFSLDERNGWLDLLEPPEPRTQKFLDAKNKALGCYQKQLSKLDPDGTLSKHFDVVTYRGRGIEKVERAAVVFDRKACAACGCKAFNDQKRKLIREAIAPAQKKAFEAYRPLLEKLSKTDFKAASQGAPKGTESHGQEL